MSKPDGDGGTLYLVTRTSHHVPHRIRKPTEQNDGEAHEQSADCYAYTHPTTSRRHFGVSLVWVSTQDMVRNQCVIYGDPIIDA